MYKLRKKPFMQRILAPFHFKHNTDNEEPERPAGPYHNIEKSAAAVSAASGGGGAANAPSSMTGDTLGSAAAVNTVRSKGPNDWDAGTAAAAAAAATAVTATNISNSRQAQRDTSTSIPRKPVNPQNLTVNTRNLTPATNSAPLSISPVSPPPSYSHLGQHSPAGGATAIPVPLAAAEISPITTSPVSQRSSLRASPSHPLSPPPVAAPPEPGTAIKIAGSEARIVRIPKPRSSRATMSSVSSGSRPGSSSAGTETNYHNNHHNYHNAATAPKYNNKFSNSYHEQYPAVTATVLPLYARPPPADARYQNYYPRRNHSPNSGRGGSYRPYHPSVGEVARQRSQRNRRAQQQWQQQPQRTQRPQQQNQQEVGVDKRASVASEASIASSGVMPPDEIAWPMPPRTPTTSPDPH